MQGKLNIYHSLTPKSSLEIKIVVSSSLILIKLICLHLSTPMQYNLLPIIVLLPNLPPNLTPTCAKAFCFYISHHPLFFPWHHFTSFSSPNIPTFSPPHVPNCTISAFFTALFFHSPYFDSFLSILISMATHHHGICLTTLAWILTLCPSYQE